MFKRSCLNTLFSHPYLSIWLISLVQLHELKQLNEPNELYKHSEFPSVLILYNTHP